MINLILAILSSALVSTAMRAGEGRIRNNMAMFVTNYLLCMGLSAAFMGSFGGIRGESGMGTAVGLGLLSGILYLGSFMLLQYNIRMNGVVMSATFMKLGVLIPTLLAILVFHERPKAVQLLGVALAVAAILLVNMEKSAAGEARYSFLLVVLLLGSGITDSMANIYDKLGSGALKDLYLLLTFGAAALCAFLLWIRQKQGICRQDVFMGICIGIPNYFSARFLLLALHEIPAVIVYPVYSVLTIVVITVIGVALFKEKLSRRKLLAIGVIFAALVFLNI